MMCDYTWLNELTRQRGGKPSWLHQSSTGVPATRRLKSARSSRYDGWKKVLSLTLAFHPDRCQCPLSVRGERPVSMQAQAQAGSIVQQASNSGYVSCGCG